MKRKSRSLDRGASVLLRMGKLRVKKIDPFKRILSRERRSDSHPDEEKDARGQESIHRRSATYDLASVRPA